MELNSYHIVQVGSDESIFKLGENSEFSQRQVQYGRFLKQLHPGSNLTNIILTNSSSAQSIQVENVRFEPLVVQLKGVSKFVAWYKLYSLLNAIHKERSIDVLTTQSVHDEAWVVLLFAFLKHCPIIGQIHYDIFSPFVTSGAMAGIFGKLRYALMLRLLPRFSALRVVGLRIAAEINRRKLHHNVSIIPVPISLITSENKLIKIESKRRKIIFVGRLAEEKNLTLWIEVAERILYAEPEIEFEIVGDGRLRSDLQTLITQKGLNRKIQLLGFIDYADLPSVYKAASVFLLTSQYEGFGRAVAEALVHEVPVVAPRITGVEDIVIDGHSGFLVQSGNVTALAERVVYLIQNPELAAEMGKNGKQYVLGHFDPELLVKKWINLLVDTLKGHKNPRIAPQ